MATKGAHKRLTKEYLTIAKNPPDYIVAKPLDSNILEWHYVLRGPPDSPFEGGEYHGKVIFPSDYPFKPPAIKMLTPNGRFQTDYRLCLSMSDYHPGTWNPAWSVATILTGLLSFMLEEAPTTGSIKTSVDEKRAYAKKSHQWNLASPKFRDVFPEFCTPELLPLSNAPIKSSASVPKVATPKAPSSTLTQRRPDSSSPSTHDNSSSSRSSASASTTSIPNNTSVGLQPIDKAHSGVRAGEAGLVAANVWQNIRSNVWRVLLLIVFLYLVVLKVVDRVAEDSR
ncbi:UBC-like protein [Phlyctochytrium arcticum]|nr:UBC-like protein [Phlyctochytrium arcticum]